VLAVTVDGASGEMRTRRLPGATSEVVAFCASLPGPTKVSGVRIPPPARRSGW